ncbi:O-antigen ligase family protein [Qipengyuania mesophila]|uniref:O-antigen ligase family protein n=1 Tax=Qipengyuania mesophila TaxID=2867246 RepID=UPI003513E1A7
MFSETLTPRAKRDIHPMHGRDLPAGEYDARTLFLLLLLLRLMSEGFDLYLGSPLSLILSLGLISLSTAMFIKQGSFPRRALVTLCSFLALTFSAILSFLFNYEFETQYQLDSIVQNLLYLSVFLTASSSHFERRHLKFFLKGIVVVTVIEALFSIYQVSTNTGFLMPDFGWSRARGLSSHPVPLSIKLFALIAFTYAFRKFISKRWEFTFYFASAISLTLTFSRTGWGIVLLWMAYIAWRSKQKGSGATMLIVGVPLVVSLLLWSGRFDDLITVTSFIERGGYREIDLTDIGNSFEWRLQHWYALVMTGLERPLIGFGPGTSEFLNRFGLKAHNSAIDTFVEQGFFGLVTIFALFCSVFFSSRKALRIPIEPVSSRYQLQSLSNVLFFGFVSAMLISVSLFNQTLNMVLFFLLFGLMINLRTRTAWTTG